MEPKCCQAAVAARMAASRCVWVAVSGYWDLWAALALQVYRRDLGYVRISYFVIDLCN